MQINPTTMVWLTSFIRSVPDKNQFKVYINQAVFFFCNWTSHPRLHPLDSGENIQGTSPSSLHHGSTIPQTGKWSRWIRIGIFFLFILFYRSMTNDAIANLPKVRLNVSNWRWIKPPIQNSLSSLSLSLNIWYMIFSFHFFFWYGCVWVLVGCYNFLVQKKELPSRVTRFYGVILQPDWVLLVLFPSFHSSGE